MHFVNAKIVRQRNIFNVITISAGSLECGEGGGVVVMPPYLSMVGTRQQSFQKLQGFSTLKSLLMKMYPPEPVIKLIQHFLFNIFIFQTFCQNQNS